MTWYVVDDDGDDMVWNRFLLFTVFTLRKTSSKWNPEMLSTSILLRHIYMDRRTGGCERSNPSAPPERPAIPVRYNARLPIKTGRKAIIIFCARRPPFAVPRIKYVRRPVVIIKPTLPVSACRAASVNTMVEEHAAKRFSSIFIRTFVLNYSLSGAAANSTHLLVFTVHLSPYR